MIDTYLSTPGAARDEGFHPDSWLPGRSVVEWASCLPEAVGDGDEVLGAQGGIGVGHRLDGEQLPVLCPLDLAADGQPRPPAHHDGRGGNADGCVPVAPGDLGDPDRL